MIATLVLVILGLIASVIVNLEQFTKIGNASERRYLLDKENSISLSRCQYDMERGITEKYAEAENRYNQRKLDVSTEIAKLEARADTLKDIYRADHLAKEGAMDAIITSQKGEVVRLKDIIDELIKNQPKQIIGIPLPVPEAAPGNGRR